MTNLGNKDALADDWILEEQKSEIQVGEDFLKYTNNSVDAMLDLMAQKDNSCHCLSMINVPLNCFFVHFKLEIKYCCGSKITRFKPSMLFVMTRSTHLIFVVFNDQFVTRL